MGSDVPFGSLHIAAAHQGIDRECVITYEGAGVYYGATHLVSQTCEGENVVVVGGGNAAVPISTSQG